MAGAGGLLEGSDGSAQVGFFARSLPTPTTLIFEVLGVNRAWRRNPVNRRYRLLDMRLDAASDVQQPAGALLLLRRDALAAVGGTGRAIPPGLVRGRGSLQASARRRLQASLQSRCGGPARGRACPLRLCPCKRGSWLGMVDYCDTPRNTFRAAGFAAFAVRFWWGWYRGPSISWRGLAGPRLRAPIGTRLAL